MLVAHLPAVQSLRETRVESKLCLGLFLLLIEAAVPTEA